MARTFIPKLLTLVYALSLYINAYRETIRENLAGDALIAFDSLDACLTGFRNKYGELPLNP